MANFECQGCHISEGQQSIISISYQNYRQICSRHCNDTRTFGIWKSPTSLFLRWTVHSDDSAPCPSVSSFRRWIGCRDPFLRRCLPTSRCNRPLRPRGRSLWSGGPRWHQSKLLPATFCNDRFARRENPVPDFALVSTVVTSFETEINNILLQISSGAMGRVSRGFWILFISKYRCVIIHEQLVNHH